MERFFYSIELEETEQGETRKVVHLLAWIYENEDDGDGSYRIAEWTYYYLYPEEIQELVEEDVFFEIVREEISYIDDLTKSKAVKMSENFFNGSRGKKLFIGDVDKDTPCGDYWFE